MCTYYRAINFRVLFIAKQEKENNRTSPEQRIWKFSSLFSKSEIVTHLIFALHVRVKRNQQMSIGCIYALQFAIALEVDCLPRIIFLKPLLLRHAVSCLISPKIWYISKTLSSHYCSYLRSSVFMDLFSFSEKLSQIFTSARLGHKRLLLRSICGLIVVDMNSRTFFLHRYCFSKAFFFSNPSECNLALLIFTDNSVKF